VKKKNSRLINIVYILIIAFLIYFVLVPILSVILYGLNAEGTVFFSLKGLERSIFHLKNSLIIAFSVTVIATSMGLVMAFALNRITFVGRRTLKVLVLLPFVNPPFVGSISFIMLFGRRGLITNRLLGLSVSPYGPHGIIFIQALGLSALAYVLISSAMNKFDVTLEEAARNLGASESSIIRQITLPLMIPEISSTALLVFLASMSDFGTPILIGGPFQTLASNLYIQITGVYDMRSASLTGIILLIPCLFAFVIQKYYLKQKSYFSDDSLSLDIEHKKITKPAKIILVAITSIFIGIIVSQYAFIVIGAFTKQWGYDYNFTLEHFQAMFGRQYKPFVNSVKLATFTAFFGSLIGILIAYLIQFKTLYKSNVVDFIATLPAAVPGILFGIGYLVTFRYPLFGIGRWVLIDREPLLLLGTGMIIYIIMTARFISTGLRTGYALIEHISPDLEKAAYNLGAGEIKTFTSIMIPLMKDAFFASYLRTFSAGMVTLGSIIFLLLPSNRVAVQQIFTIMASSSIGAAATMSLSLSLLTLVLLGFFYSVFNFKEISGTIKGKGKR
jgi:iron(III) transport system permease protein